MAATTTVSTTVTMRLPNSTREWNWRGGVRWPRVQSGQSAQPSPEPVSRTAAPVTTISETMTREATQRRRNQAAETVGRRDARPVWGVGLGPDTPVNRTGARPSPPVGVGAVWSGDGVDRRLWAMASRPPRCAASEQVGRVLGAYVALTKPRIIELLLVTTLPTMVVAERGLPPLGLVVATLVGGALAAGGANAINMFVDRDIDRLMHRTRKRPLVTGAVTPRAALTFALSLEVAAFVELWLARQPALGGPRRVGHRLLRLRLHAVAEAALDSQNIVIGGAAGAVPVLVGWAAVTGSLSWTPVVLFAIIFIWTPPHFWALAVRYRDDYQTADVPMLPVVASHASGPPGDPRLHGGPGGGDPPLRAGGRHGAPLHRDARRCWERCSSPWRRGLWDRARAGTRPPAPTPCGCSAYSITYLTLLFVVMAVDVLVRYR